MNRRSEVKSRSPPVRRRRQSSFSGVCRIGPQYNGWQIREVSPSAPVALANRARSSRIIPSAKSAGVTFASVIDKPATPYDGIIAAAKKTKCDVIFMSSHGRRGLAGIVLGSVTNKVLSHSKIPVLVYR